MSKTMQHPYDDFTCFQVDIVDNIVENFQEDLLIDPLERCIMQAKTIDDEDPCIQESVKQLEDGLAVSQEEEQPQELNQTKPESKSFVEESPKIELKTLPSHLKYVFLEGNSSLPVIISSSLTGEIEAQLLEVLWKHKRALGRTIADIKGISPSICMHKILMEENFKLTVQPQRRLNPVM